jgi:hypothetical protein
MKNRRLPQGNKVLEDEIEIESEGTDAKIKILSRIAKKFNLQMNHHFREFVTM